MNYRNSIYYLLLIGFFLPSLSFASLEPPSNIIASTNQYSYGSWVYWDPVPDAKAYSVKVQVRNQIPTRNDYDTVETITTGNFYRLSGWAPTADIRFVVYSCEDIGCEIKSEKWASIIGKSSVDKRFKTETPFSYSYSEDVGILKIDVAKEALKSFQNMTDTETSNIRISVSESCEVACIWPGSRSLIKIDDLYNFGKSIRYSERENLKSTGKTFSVEVRLCSMVEVLPLRTPSFNDSSKFAFLLEGGVREPFCVDNSQSFEIVRYSDATWESKIKAIDEEDGSMSQNNAENQGTGNNLNEDKGGTTEENVTTDGVIETNDGEDASQIRGASLGTLSWGGDFGSTNWHEIPKTGVYSEFIDSALKFEAKNVRKFSGSNYPEVAAMKFFQGSYEEWENSWGPDIIFGSLNSNTKEVKTNFRESELIEVYASIKSGDERVGVNGGEIHIFVKAKIGSDILYGFNGIINGWEIWDFGKNWPLRASRAGGEWPSLIGHLAGDERVSVLQGVALPVGTYEFHVLLVSCKNSCSAHMNLDPFVVTVSP